MKLSKKTRSLMAASAGASALLACVTAGAQEPAAIRRAAPVLLQANQLPAAQAPAAQAPAALPIPQGARVAPQIIVPGAIAPPPAHKTVLSPVVLNSIFTAADSNKDGTLSPAEFRSAYKKIIDATTPKVMLPNPGVIDPLANGCPGCGLG